MDLSPELKNLDTVVLYGGPGAEREVSLQSGAQVAAALRSGGCRARLLDVSGEPEQIRELTADMAFVALHGEFGEDGSVQALLAERGLPFTGSGADACRLTIDKDATKRKLRAAGLPTAPWTVVTNPAEAEAAWSRAELGLPVVAKPVSRGSSVGVTIVKERGQIAAAVAEALRHDSRAMLEKFIPGAELTVGMLAGASLPLVEIRPAAGVEFYDYRAKYTDDKTGYLCPAPVAAEAARRLGELGSRVFALLGCEQFGRVDFRGTPEEAFVLEVNTIPGFTSHSLLPMAAKAAGLDFTRLCLTILDLAWRRARTPAERANG